MKDGLGDGACAKVGLPSPMDAVCSDMPRALRKHHRQRPRNKLGRMNMAAFARRELAHFISASFFFFFSFRALAINSSRYEEPTPCAI